MAEYAGPQYLFFLARGQRFALEIRWVEEIVLSRPAVPVPLAPPFITGIMNLRGRVVTILSLGELLGLGGMGGPAGVMVVLRLPEMALAIGAEEIVDIQRLKGGDLGEVTTGEGQGAGSVKAVFQHGGHPVSLLDVERLVSHLLSCDYQSGRLSAVAEGR